MRFVTYNIRYALGKEQRFDLTRIDDAAQGSDHQPVWAELDL